MVATIGDILPTAARRFSAKTAPMRSTSTKFLFFALALTVSQFALSAQPRTSHRNPVLDHAVLEKLVQNRKSAPNNIGPYPDSAVLAEVEKVFSPRRSVSSRLLIHSHTTRPLYTTIAIVGPITKAELIELIATCGYFGPEIFKVVSNGRYAKVSSGALFSNGSGAWSDLTFEKITVGWKFRFQQDWVL